ncbi:MAG: hypothetical protein HY261_08525, partial [Chloroflexi bacterium]|nr:hypothetical protein [Chloroflexota bacterium]
MDAVQSELDEIELNISRIPPDKFTVQLRVRLANSDSDQILSPVPFELPANLGDAVDQPDVYGKLLGDALFAAEELRKKMSEVVGPKRDHPLRLRLLSDDEEIQRQRWEAVCFDGQPLFDRRICLSRFLSPDAAPERPPLRPSLK